MASGSRVEYVVDALVPQTAWGQFPALRACQTCLRVVSLDAMQAGRSKF